MSQLQRTFIGIFGRRNQGKSALINALAEWDNGGEEKYTPYFLDTFMPVYDRVGDLYR